MPCFRANMCVITHVFANKTNSSTLVEHQVHIATQLECITMQSEHGTFPCCKTPPGTRCRNFGSPGPAALTKTVTAFVCLISQNLLDKTTLGTLEVFTPTYKEENFRNRSSLFGGAVLLILRVLYPSEDSPQRRVRYISHCTQASLHADYVSTERVPWESPD